MEDQINEVLKTFREKTTKDVASDAARHLLMINNNAEKLLKERAEIFHSVTD